MAPLQDRYDVITLGGAFSGASTAILLRRECPGLRVLVVEKAEAFDEKVGEATTEMSAMFLTRRLAVWEHLERQQPPKEGVRYWFSNEKVTGHANATEAGGFVRSTVPAFQLRRDALDEHLLFHWMPVLGPKPAFISYHIMRLYNRRFKAIAETRRAAGETGKYNDGRRIKAYFNLELAPFRMALRGLKFWMKAEIDNVRLQFKRKPVAAEVTTSPVPPA